jgi:capsular exopolysaccharide synthesis family protein
MPTSRPSPAGLSVEEAESPFNILYFASLVARWAWLLGGILLAALVLAFIYLRVATPYYQATTVVQVEQQQQHVFKSDTGDNGSDDLKSDDILKTIEQNIQAPELFLKVASDPAILQDKNLYVGLSPHATPLSTSDLADTLAANTHVSLRRGTRLIDISVDHPVPVMAQRLSLAVAEAYISQSGQIDTETSTGVESQLLADSERMKAKLQKSEDALATYREVLLLKDRISDQQRILDALRQRYRAKHPTLIQAETLMSELVLDFDQEVRKIRANSTLEAGYWIDQDPLLNGLTTKDRVQTELQLVEARTNVLDGEVQTERSLFNNVLKQMSEAAMSEQAAPTTVLIVNQPSLPQRPVRPQKKVVLVIAVAGGLVLGLGLVFLLNALDSSFKTAEEVEQYLGLPVLGAIPRIPPLKKNVVPSPKANRSMVLIDEPGGLAAESFRSMRAAVGLLGKSEDHRTVLFTSALAAEGKTFVACNYAVSLAQQNIKTLLMDIDLRVPAVHQFFKIDNSRGIVDHVTESTPLEKSIRENVVPNLDVMTAGRKCPNPAEFLAGNGFSDTLKEALTKYKRVVVDCSPINLVSDALLIVEHVQSVILIVRAKSTPRRDSKFALNTLQRAQIQPVGVVINAIPDWTRSLYHSHPGRYGADNKYMRAYTASPGGS